MAMTEEEKKEFFEKIGLKRPEKIPEGIIFPANIREEKITKGAGGVDVGNGAEDY